MLPLHIISKILQFVIIKPYKLIDFIPRDKLQFSSLKDEYRCNKKLGLQVEHKFSFDDETKDSFSFITQTDDVEKLDWEELCLDENALDMIRKYPRLICWPTLSANPNAIDLLEENLHLVNWCFLCENPNAIRIIEKNPDKICWMSLSRNPNALHIIEQNLDKINWKFLSENPGAIDLLRKHQDKIDFYHVSRNPSIFEHDHDKYQSILLQEVNNIG